MVEIDVRSHAATSPFTSFPETKSLALHSRENHAENVVYRLIRLEWSNETILILVVLVFIGAEIPVPYRKKTRNQSLLMKLFKSIGCLVWHVDILLNLYQQPS